jgi:hypothetical protein
MAVGLGRVKANLHSFLTSGLNGDESLNSSDGRLNPEKRNPVPTSEEDVWALRRSGSVRKERNVLTLSGIELRIIQPVA